MIGRRSYTAGVTAHTAFAERPAEKPKAPDPRIGICCACTRKECKGDCELMHPGRTSKPRRRKQAGGD